MPRWLAWSLLLQGRRSMSSTRLEAFSRPRGADENPCSVRRFSRRCATDVPAVGRRARARLPPARAAHDALPRRARSRHSDGRSDVHALHANAFHWACRRRCTISSTWLRCRRSISSRCHSPRRCPRSPLQIQSAALATYAPREISSGDWAVAAIGDSFPARADVKRIFDQR